MKLTLDKSSDVPIYLQIVDQVLEMIRSGELVSGEKLPTERELKQEYSISVGTAKAAYKKLVQMNKVISVQGSGTYVMRMETELEMAHLARRNRPGAEPGIFSRNYRRADPGYTRTGNRAFQAQNAQCAYRVGMCLRGAFGNDRCGIGQHAACKAGQFYDCAKSKGILLFCKIISIWLSLRSVITHRYAGFCQISATAFIRFH